MERQFLRKRGLEDKVIFLENNIHSLIEQNHKLKDNMIKKNKQQSITLEVVIKQLQKSLIAKSFKFTSDNQIEMIKFYIKAFDNEIIKKNKQSVELKSEINMKNQVIKNYQNKVLELNSINESLKINQEIESKKKEDSYRNKENEYLVQKQNFMKNIEALQKELAQKSKIIQQIRNTYEIDIQSIKIQHSKVKQQFDKELSIYKQKLQRIKLVNQQARRSLIMSISANLEIKKQQNQKLIQIIKRLNNKQKNFQIQQSITMINYRQQLEKKVDQYKYIISDKDEKIELLEEKIRQDTKNYFEMSINLNKKNSECQKNKHSIEQYKETIKKYEEEIRVLKNSIQKYKTTKQQSDQVLGRRWQQQIQKIILDYQRQKYIQLEKYRVKKEKQCQQQKKKIVSQLKNCQYIIKKLQEKLEKQNVIKLQNQKKIESLSQNLIIQQKMYKQNDNILNSIIQQRTLELKIQNEKIVKLQKSIQQKLIEIKDKQNLINQLNQQLKQIKIEVRYQKEQLIEENQKKITEMLKLKQQERLQTLKSVSQKYLNDIYNLKINYEAEIQNLTITRELIKNRCNDQVQQAKNIQIKKLEEFKKSSEVIKNNLQLLIKQQKIEKILLIQNHNYEKEELKKQLNIQIQLKQKLLNSVKQLQLKIKQSKNIENNLLKQIIQYKQQIQNFQKVIIVQLRNIIQKQQLQKQKYHSENKNWNQRFKNIKTEIVLAKQQMRKQFNELNLRNQKLVHFYKQKLRNLEQYILKSPNQEILAKQLYSLKHVNQQLSQNLTKTQAEILNMKQTQKYHEMKIETLTKKQKMNKTERKYKQRNLTQQNTLEYFPQTPSKTINSNKSTYIKRGKRYKILQSNYVKSGITNYGLLKGTMKQFRLNSRERKEDDDEYF